MEALALGSNTVHSKAESLSSDSNICVKWQQVVFLLPSYFPSSYKQHCCLGFTQTFFSHGSVSSMRAFTAYTQCSRMSKTSQPRKPTSIIDSSPKYFLWFFSDVSILRTVFSASFLSSSLNPVFSEHLLLPLLILTVFVIQLLQLIHW